MRYNCPCYFVPNHHRWRVYCSPFCMISALPTKYLRSKSKGNQYTSSSHISLYGIGRCSVPVVPTVSLVSNHCGRISSDLQKIELSRFNMDPKMLTPLHNQNIHQRGKRQRGKRPDFPQLQRGVLPHVPREPVFLPLPRRRLLWH